MNYILLTSENYKSCDNARRLLEENGLDYREVNARTTEGTDLALKYNTNSMPVIIDEDSRMIFSINDFNAYLEMINKEY